MPGDSGIVVDDLAFGETNFGVHHLVEIGEANVSTHDAHG